MLLNVVKSEVWHQKDCKRKCMWEEEDQENTADS